MLPREEQSPQRGCKHVSYCFHVAAYSSLNISKVSVECLLSGMPKSQWKYLFFTLEEGSDAIGDVTANAPALLVSTKAAVQRTAPERPQTQRRYWGPLNAVTPQLKARKRKEEGLSLRLKAVARTELPHQVPVTSQREPDPAGPLTGPRWQMWQWRLALRLSPLPHPFQARALSPLQTSSLSRAKCLTAPTNSCNPYLLQVQASGNFPVFTVFLLLPSLSSKSL